MADVSATTAVLGDVVAKVSSLLILIEAAATSIVRSPSGGSGGEAVVANIGRYEGC